MVTITTPLLASGGATSLYISENRYAFIATGSAIQVIDLFNQQTIASGTLPSIPTTVATDVSPGNRKIYVGTTISGIFAAPYNPAIQHPGIDITPNFSQLFTTASVPSILSNSVSFLSTAPSRLLISSTSGVNFITNETLGAFRFLSPGSSKCALTASGEAYWIVNASGVEVTYNIFPSSGTGIIPVDFQYNGTTSVPLLPSSIVTDIVVSKTTNNLLGFATAGGDFIVSEVQHFENTSPTKSLDLGDSLVSIAFGPSATFSSGRAYLANSAILSVYDLANNTASGTHSAFAATDFQTLTTGTINIVRTTNVA